MVGMSNCEILRHHDFRTCVDTYITIYHDMGINYHDYHIMPIFSTSAEMTLNSRILHFIVFLCTLIYHLFGFHNMVQEGSHLTR